MPRLVWAVLCRRAVIDKYTNLASVHDVVDSLFAAQEPEMGSQIIIDLNVITNWARSDFALPEDPFYCRCVAVHPNGSRGRGAALEVNLSLSSRVRNVFRFPGIDFSGFGEYEFVVERAPTKDSPDRDWHVAFRIPLQVAPQSDD